RVGATGFGPVTSWSQGRVLHREKQRNFLQIHALRDSTSYTVSIKTQGWQRFWCKLVQITAPSTVRVFPCGIGHLLAIRTRGERHNHPRPGFGELFFRRRIDSLAMINSRHTWKVQGGDVRLRVDWAMTFSRDGKVLAIANPEGRSHVLSLWDTATGKKLRQAAVERMGFALAASPDGKLLATSGFQHVILLAADTLKEVGRMPI